MKSYPGYFYITHSDEYYLSGTDYKLYRRFNNKMVEVVASMEDEYPWWYISFDGNYVKYPCHRLVAEEFVPNPHHLPVVNHIDGNKFNWNADNLEWCSHSENTLHAYRTGLNKHTTDMNQVRRICEQLEMNLPIQVVADKNGVSYQVVWNIKHGIRHTQISKDYNFVTK